MGWNTCHMARDLATTYPLGYLEEDGVAALYTFGLRFASSCLAPRSSLSLYSICSVYGELCPRSDPSRPSNESSIQAPIQQILIRQNH